MVRTKADASSVRAAGAKAPRKVLVTNAGSSKKSNPYNGGGGNPVCPRETPDWQKSIKCFFTKASEKNIDSQDFPNSDVAENGVIKAHAKGNGSEVEG